jgi:MurNAc alpha-1-phosphate uridylyltransferase
MCRIWKKTKSTNIRYPETFNKFNNITVLETCINLIESLGIQQIIINTFYLKDQIHSFINVINLDLKFQLLKTVIKFLILVVA